ncbi:uncharacterized protein LAESUDRAFT_809315 [Laetiporus sulphureus 93-53]|uniref:AIG1-type G domain-containing protein n=1 Tax=Laetiporus sulphureus 93-53 TaxID=1314785 RepID=A0A165H828_9APHY|nr:uncharacterized protein LAESUDRAFT_809315 [Laetiporus sulphureus 93-53]KZT11375.1 hypothetical protein LAESUDRAFT_809315 [Laetiporus sulphureus 93-53]
MAYSNLKVIIVTGPSGTGKTQFINKVADSNLPEGEGSLEPCTRQIQEEKVSIDGSAVLLIDTPGFDAEEVSKIKKKIAEHLRWKYNEGADVVGMVYMHSMSDNRIGDNVMKSLKAFRDICGDEAMSHAVIVTNMWTRIRKEVGEGRERDLKLGEYGFRDAIEKGAKLRRHDGSAESARDIVKQLMQNQAIVLPCQSPVPSGSGESNCSEKWSEGCTVTAESESTTSCCFKLPFFRRRK